MEDSQYVPPSGLNNLAHLKTLNYIIRGLGESSSSNLYTQKQLGVQIYKSTMNNDLLSFLDVRNEKSDQTPIDASKNGRRKLIPTSSCHIGCKNKCTLAIVADIFN